MAGTGRAGGGGPARLRDPLLSDVGMPRFGTAGGGSFAGGTTFEPDVPGLPGMGGFGFSEAAGGAGLGGIVSNKNKVPSI